jgi:hypothetical protein
MDEETRELACRATFLVRWDPDVEKWEVVWVSPPEVHRGEYIRDEDLDLYKEA